MTKLSRNAIIASLLAIGIIGIFGFVNSQLKFYSIPRGSPPTFTPKLPAIYPPEAKSCKEDNECITFTCQCGLSLRKDYKGPPPPPGNVCMVVCDIEPKCINNQCKGVNIFECKSDADCVIPTGQCSCSERAINKKYTSDWNTRHSPQRYCPTVICTEPKAVCENNRCGIKR